MKTKEKLMLCILVVFIVLSGIIIGYLFSLRNPKIPEYILKMNPNLAISGYEGRIYESGLFKYDTSLKEIHINVETDITSLKGDFKCDTATFSNNDTTILILNPSGTYWDTSYDVYTESELINPWLDIPSSVFYKNRKINDTIVFTVKFDLNYPGRVGHNNYKLFQETFTKKLRIFCASPKDFYIVSDFLFYKEHRNMSIIISVLFLLLSVFFLIKRKRIFQENDFLVIFISVYSFSILVIIFFIIDFSDHIHFH